MSNIMRATRAPAPPARRPLVSRWTVPGHLAELPFTYQVPMGGFRAHPFPALLEAQRKYKLGWVYHLTYSLHLPDPTLESLLARSTIWTFNLTFTLSPGQVAYAI